MLRCYLTSDTGVMEKAEPTAKGAWIHLTAPTEDELRQVEAATGVFPDFVRAPLDDEELPRAETDEGQTLIIFNVPILENGSNGDPAYRVLPLGMIIANDRLITVCLQPHPVLEDFAAGKVKGLHTHKRTRFVFYLLLKAAGLYLRFLDQVDRRTNEIEDRLMASTRNEEVIRLLNLSKSLTYFTTSLRSNAIVLEKLLKTKMLPMYPEDEDLLEDAITENRQAIEVADIHSNILSGTMDAFASIISNNLGRVLRFLTSVTIVLAIPTIVASYFGQNLTLPFASHPLAFWFSIGISVVLSVAAILWLVKKKMF